MSVPADPDAEKTVIVYYDDSTGEIFTDRDGHFHFTDLSGEQFRKLQDNHNRRHHHGEGSQPASSHAVARGRGTEPASAAGITVDFPGEDLLNTLLATGINIPIATYRAHQAEVRRQQQLQHQQKQQAQRQAVHPQVRALCGRQDSPLLVRHLSEVDADAYISAMKQAWEKQRRIQAEMKMEGELRRQIGSQKSNWTRSQDEQEAESRPLVPVRIGRVRFEARSDGSRGAFPEVQRTSCSDIVADEEADERSPGEVKFFERLRNALEQNLSDVGSGGHRGEHKQKLSPTQRTSVERYDSPKRKPRAAVHPARLVQTPQGLVIHFDSHGEPESESEYVSRSPSARGSEDENEEPGIKEEHEEGTDDQKRYHRLLRRVGELSRIRAFVEQEEARLVARLRARDLEVYRRQRRAELEARTRWAVEEQNRLTREAEELMIAADEKYERVTRLSELITSAERSLESLSAGLGGQVVNRDEHATTGAKGSSVDRLLRDVRRAREPDMELTADEKDLLRGFNQYRLREADNRTRPRWSDDDASTSGEQLFESDISPDFGGDSTRSIERPSFRSRGVDEPRGWKDLPSESRARPSLPSDFRRQSQFDGNRDVDIVTRRKQGLKDADDYAVFVDRLWQLRSFLQQQGSRQGELPIRQDANFRAIEDIINGAYAAASRGSVTQLDVEGLLNMISNHYSRRVSDKAEDENATDREKGNRQDSSRICRPSSKQSEAEVLSASTRSSAAAFARSVSPAPATLRRASRTSSPAMRAVSPSGGSQRRQQLGDFIDGVVRDVLTGHGNDQCARRDDENRRQGSLEAPTPQRCMPLSSVAARAASPASSDRYSQRGQSVRSPSRSSARSANSTSAIAATDVRTRPTRCPRPSTPDSRRSRFVNENGYCGTITITPARQEEEQILQVRQREKQKAAATKIGRFLRNRLETSTDRQALHNLKILTQKEREIRALKERTADDQDEHMLQQEHRRDDPRTPSPTPSGRSQPRCRHRPVSRARAFAEPITVVMHSTPGKELTQFDWDGALPPGVHVHPRHHDFLAYESELNRILTELDGIESAGNNEIRDYRRRLVEELNDLLAEVDAKKREVYNAEWERKEESEEVKEGRDRVEPLQSSRSNGEEEKRADSSWDKLSELNGQNKNIENGDVKERAEDEPLQCS